MANKGMTIEPSTDQQHGAVSTSSTLELPTVAAPTPEQQTLAHVGVPGGSPRIGQIPELLPTPPHEQRPENGMRQGAPEDATELERAAAEHDLAATRAGEAKRRARALAAQFDRAKRQVNDLKSRLADASRKLQELVPLADDAAQESVQADKVAKRAVQALRSARRGAEPGLEGRLKATGTKRRGKSPQGKLPKNEMPRDETPQAELGERPPMTKRARHRAPPPAKRDGESHLGRDRLLPLLRDTTSAEKTLRDNLLRDGYAVVSGVLGPEQCDAGLDELWNFVEFVTQRHPTPVDRRRPETWRDWPATHRGALFQSYGAGWAPRRTRLLVLAWIRRVLFRDDAGPLLCSIDGFVLDRPTRRLRSGGALDDERLWHVDQTPRPAAGAPRGGKLSSGKTGGEEGGEEGGEAGGETVEAVHGAEPGEEAAGDLGLHWIQTSVQLNDQPPGVAGCFQCLPGTHVVSQALAAIGKGKNHWYVLSDADLERLRGEGFRPRRVELARGSLLLWDSRLVHRGGVSLPSAPQDRIGRAAVFVCALPRTLVPATELEARRRRYATGKLSTGGHAPDKTRTFFIVDRWREMGPTRGLANVLRAPETLDLNEKQTYGLE